MNNAQYQAIRAVSSHWLIAMLDSPASCWKKYLAPQRETISTDALRLGTLVHCLALTPRQFEREFVVADYDRRSNAGKARYAELAETGLTVIRPAELERARAMVAALRANPDSRKLLRHGKKERTFIQPRGNGLLPLKARLDIHHETRRGVVELKTTFDLQRFNASLERYHYPLSAAFYIDISRSASVEFVVVQTRAPYEVETFSMSREQLNEGRDQWKTALERFDACWKTGEWPEADPTPVDDDPLMMNFMPANQSRARARFDIPLGELAL